MAKREKLSELEKSFHTFLGSVSFDARPENLDRVRKYHDSYELGDYPLNWNDALYEQVIEVLSNEFQNVSQKTFRNLLPDAIEQLIVKHVTTQNKVYVANVSEILDKQAINDCLKSLIELLKSKVQSYTFYIPVEGLDLALDTGELRLGKFTLYSAQSGPLPELLSYADDPQVARDIKADFESSKCYVVVGQIDGDRIFAAKQALEVSQDIVHMLNFFLTSYHLRTNNLYHKISLVDRPTITKDQIICYSSNIGIGVNTSTLQTNNYSINLGTIQYCERLGLRKIIECFSDVKPKNSSDNIPSKICRAVTWYSKSVNADGLEESFVALATSLESLLLTNPRNTDLNDNWGSISQRLADRVTFLLGNIYTERIALLKRTKDLYGRRSKIVHEGDTISQKELIEMERLVHSVIVTFVKHDFSSWASFEEWERQQKYSV